MNIDEIEGNEFLENYHIDVSDYIEVKNKKPDPNKTKELTYLAWASAVKFFKERYPKGYWIKEKHWKDVDGWFVSTIVYKDPEEQPIREILPLFTIVKLEGAIPIASPNVVDINTAYQRCLTRNIAIATGIGLSLYIDEEVMPSKEDMLSIENIREFITFYIPKVLDKAEAGNYDIRKLPTLIKKVLTKEIDYEKVKKA